jgi:hypothetical protein
MQATAYADACVVVAGGRSAADNAVDNCLCCDVLATTNYSASCCC